MLKTLSYREREIIKLRYGLGDGYSYTLEEVGHIFKVTRERIRQIEAKAVRKLQQPSRSQELVGFLDSAIVPVVDKRQKVAKEPDILVRLFFICAKWQNATRVAERKERSAGRIPDVRLVFRRRATSGCKAAAPAAAF